MFYRELCTIISLNLLAHIDFFILMTLWNKEKAKEQEKSICSRVKISQKKDSNVGRNEKMSSRIRLHERDRNKL